jgi:hypothetical protein
MLSPYFAAVVGFQGEPIRCSSADIEHLAALGSLTKSRASAAVRDRRE